MKHTLVVIVAAALSAGAAEPADWRALIGAAAMLDDGEYVGARDRIVSLGAPVAPSLVRAGNDPRLRWQERLMARICYERIARRNDVESLRRHDWRTQSGYEKWWESGMRGPAGRIGTIAIPHLVEVGLWYYYIELTWKRSGESSLAPIENIEVYWCRWCREALAGQPEETFLRRAMAERLEMDAKLESTDARDIYGELRDSVDPLAVPTLVARYDAFSRLQVTGLELYGGAHAQSYRSGFSLILRAADARHADLLERFVADHAELADLKPKLAEVRVRRAAAASSEPPLRLGRLPVVAR